MDKNINFKISYLKFFFWKYYFVHTTFLYLSRHSSGSHQSCSFNFKFSSKKSQNEQKLTKRIRQFTIQFRPKHLTHFMNRNSLDVVNNMPPQSSQKPFWIYKFSSKHVSIWCQKNFPLYHLLTPKNCILEALWKQMFVYFHIFP